MARFFPTRGTVATASSTPVVPAQHVAPAVPSRPVGVVCASYQPGHLMHYIQQGQALRSASGRVETVLVDGQRVVLVLESGAHLDWRHHDTDRLRVLLDRFPTSRVAYQRYHALRVGPYWFNCAPLGQFSPCLDPG